MTASTDQILQVVYRCVDEANRMLPPESRLARQPQTVLVGENGALDSLALINLLVDLEESLQAQLGVSCFLLDESLLVDPDGPFRDVGALAQWIADKAK